MVQAEVAAGALQFLVLIIPLMFGTHFVELPFMLMTAHQTDWLFPRQWYSIDQHCSLNAIAGTITHLTHRGGVGDHGTLRRKESADVVRTLQRQGWLIHTSWR